MTKINKREESVSKVNDFQPEINKINNYISNNR